MTFGRRNGGGRRQSQRVKAPLPALLITMTDRHPAILFNVSETGAQLRAKDAPQPGTELFLQVGELDVYANVVWKRGEHCGLKFERQIRPWDVEVLHCEAAKGVSARITAAEKGGADDWNSGVAR
ncbi:MAG TPA: PilZ domain-containing protein [Sphingomicrobium sp.]|nr:PilZ domain-containing protein [Sphingomicrobium sp.]